MTPQNAPQITFSAARCAGGYHPVSDANDPGGFFGGQRVWKLFKFPTHEEAVIAAERLYWKRIEETKW
jgi:hypothetical protein